MPFHARRSRTVAFALCLFLWVVGARLATIDRFGSAMPDNDQWDAEARHLLIPWFEEDRFVEHLFTPHNEHRVVLTKLQALALTLLNGQWDARVENGVNTLLSGALAVSWWLLARRWLTRGASAAEAGHAALPAAAAGSGLIYLLSAALHGLPLAWENVLGGFHSQQYWLIALSLVTMVALPVAPTATLRWWTGVVAAVLAMFTMGSGFFASGVVFALVGWRMARRETTFAQTWPTLALTGTLVVVGLLTRVHVPHHEPLKARTPAEFVLYVLRSLEWPLHRHDWGLVLLWAPWFIIAGRCVARKADGHANSSEPRRVPRPLIALGAWVLLQVAATAYARGADANYPAPRYLDTLAVGVMTNGIALAWWWQAGAGSRVARLAQLGLSIAWLCAVAIGIGTVSGNIFRHNLPNLKSYYSEAENRLRDYLATGDPAHLAQGRIPYPSAEGLIEPLAHPALRARLPDPVRAPLSLSPVADNTKASVATFFPGAASSFPPDLPWTATRHTWSSFSAERPGTGEWRSAGIQASLGAWLKFDVAGRSGDRALALELRDAQTDRVLALVRPRFPLNGSREWQSVYLRAPQGRFVVVARDDSLEGWLAFAEPVELGHLSYWAGQAARHGMLLVGCAAGIAGLLAAMTGVGIIWTGRSRRV